MTPKISVIVPVYNPPENYLRECLDSICNQTLKDIEIILIDNAATGNNPQILQEYAQRDKRIKLFRFEKNQGYSGACNKGLEIATGKYIHFVDSDDYIAPNLYKKLYTKASTQKLEITFFRTAVLTPDGKQDKKHDKFYSYSAIPQSIKQLTLNFNDISDIFPYIPSQVWNKLFNRNYLSKYNIRFDNKLQTILVDKFFSINSYLKAEKIGFINYKGYFYRSNLQNSVTSYISLKNKLTVFVFCKKILKLASQTPNIKFRNSCKIVMVAALKMFLSPKTSFLSHIFLKKYWKKIKKIMPTSNHTYEDTYILNNLHIFKTRISSLATKIKLRIQPSITNHKMPISNNDYTLVAASSLWNEAYYIQHSEFTNNRLNGQTPLEHYLTTGYKNNISPSKLFNGSQYLERYQDVKTNPLLHFLKVGRFNYYWAFKTNVYTYNESMITQYIEYKKQRKSNKVAYICIIDDYDDLNEIKAYTYFDKEWDYVCFTDNQDLISQKQYGIWEIRPLAYTKLDKTRNNRWHKLHPHTLFPDYEYSLYLDANINILSSYIFDVIKKENKILLLLSHCCRFDAYDENIVVHRTKADRNTLIEAGMEIMEKDGFPRNYGLSENNVIFRQHHNQQIINTMETWWYMIEHYARRDQCYFTYSLWKNGLEVRKYLIPNTRILYNDFCVFIHKANRS